MTAAAVVLHSGARMSNDRKKKAKPKKPCSFPGCPHELRARDLCNGHLMQQKRHPGEPLRPLRLEAGVKLPGLTVSQACGDALESEGPSAYEAARAVLEAWAKKRRS